MNKLADNFQWDSEDLRRRHSPAPPATASPRYWRYGNVMDERPRHILPWGCLI